MTFPSNPIFVLHNVDVLITEGPAHHFLQHGAKQERHLLDTWLPMGGSQIECDWRERVHLKDRLMLW
jgi:hypothetical protein